MYPSKGISENGILSLAFDTHNAAPAREKRQEINVTHSGLAWSTIFSLIQAFTKTKVVLCRVYSGNPVDILCKLVDILCKL
jgi:hypothetical protein